MADPIAIASVILAVGTALGGLFGYFHLKLKSNCCGCCVLSCSEKRKDIFTPPDTPLPYPPKEENNEINV